MIDRLFGSHMLGIFQMIFKIISQPKIQIGDNKNKIKCPSLPIFAQLNFNTSFKVETLINHHIAHVQTAQSGTLIPFFL